MIINANSVEVGICRFACSDRVILLHAKST